MWGSTIVRVLAVLVLAGLVFGIGTTVYNAGVSAGITEGVQQAVASGDPAPVITVPGYGYGHGHGWGSPYWHGPGFFGILLWIFGFFLVLALLRAAFGWGRGGGRGGPGGWGGRRERMEELHRELHARDAATGEHPAGA